MNGTVIGICGYFDLLTAHLSKLHTLSIISFAFCLIGIFIVTVFNVTTLIVQIKTPTKGVLFFKLMQVMGWSTTFKSFHGFAKILAFNVFLVDLDSFSDRFCKLMTWLDMSTSACICVSLFSISIIQCLTYYRPRLDFR
ncbi:hypothetical protein ACOME3_002703 [Neoechinorhynchus agilis]